MRKRAPGGLPGLLFYCADITGYNDDHDVLISMQDEAAFQDLAHIKLYGLISTALTQRVQLDSSNMRIEYSPPLQRTRRSVFVAVEPLSSHSRLE